MEGKIKATELRIGNLVQFGINIVPIKSIYTGHFLNKDITIYVELNQKLSHYCLKIEEISPIQLTEEWFNRFDWEYIVSFGFSVECENFEYFQEKAIFYYNGREIWKRPKFLHEWQNIFYALTGEELIIKQQQWKIK